MTADIGIRHAPPGSAVRSCRDPTHFTSRQTFLFSFSSTLAELPRLSGRSRYLWCTCVRVGVYLRLGRPLCVRVLDWVHADVCSTTAPLCSTRVWTIPGPHHPGRAGGRGRSANHTRHNTPVSGAHARRYHSARSPPANEKCSLNAVSMLDQRWTNVGPNIRTTLRQSATLAQN